MLKSRLGCWNLNSEQGPDLGKSFSAWTSAWGRGPIDSCVPQNSPIWPSGIRRSLWRRQCRGWSRAGQSWKAVRTVRRLRGSSWREMKRGCRKTSQPGALQQNTWGDLGRVHARMPVLLGGQWFAHLSRWQTLVFPVLVQHSSPHTGPVLPSFSVFWPGSLKTSCNSEPATIDLLCSSTCSWPTGCPSLFTIAKLNSLPLGAA